MGNVFDRRHWWRSCDKEWVTPLAAIYELARRHPRIGELRREFHQKKWFGQEFRMRLNKKERDKIASAAFDDLGHESRAVHCLCLIGLKIWPELGWKYNEYWEMSVGTLKGVDCRSDTEQCASLSRQALSDLTWERIRQLPLDAAGLKFRVQAGSRDSFKTKVRPIDREATERNQHMIAESLRQKPIPAVKIEREIARLAKAAYRAGDWIFSISPNITRARATELLSRAFTSERRMANSSTDRARWRDWFSLIETYERDEIEFRGAKAQAFARYRRAIDGINFAHSGM